MNCIVSDFMRQSLDGNFQKLASVTDESGWEKFITTKKTTSPKGDVLDCSTECEVFQASCDIFVFHVNLLLFSMLKAQNMHFLLLPEYHLLCRNNVSFCWKF